MAKIDPVSDCRTPVITQRLMNTFCRKYDLIFIESGMERGDPVYRFIDHNNRECFYSAPEIHDKLML